MTILRAIWRDLAHAGRSLAKSRAFTVVCVVTLGIGMAPAIAIQYASRIFTTAPPGVNAERPTELVELVTTRVGKQKATSEWSYPDFNDLRNAETGVSITGWAIGESVVTLQDSGSKTRPQTMFVAANYFQTIGVTLVRGTGFVNANTTDPTEPSVILGNAFWQKRLAGDPDIVGKMLTVNGAPHVVVGITPDKFCGHLSTHDVELFLPLERHPFLLADAKARFDRSKAFVNIHGRLKPGLSVAQASAAASAVTSQLAKEYPATNETRAGIVVPYQAAGSLSGVEITALLIFWHVLTAIPLLIVCLNVSGMVQVRSAMRERELSIRQAIGASRRRLVQYLLAEAVVLATLGGTLASIVLFNIPPLLSWWLGEPIPAKLENALRVDLRMLAICFGICLATSLVFGWLPALRFSRPRIMTVLKDEAGTSGIRAGRIHRIATALQIGIAVPLLVMSFVSLERVRATANADLGFNAGLLSAAPIEIAGSGLRTMRDNLAKASGVASVTVADGLPLDSRYRMARVATQTGAGVAPKVALAHVTRVGDGFLETMGIGLVRGRRFTIDDGAGAPLVTIVSKALADRFFPRADAIGQQLTFGAQSDDKQKPQTLTIVGVTADFPTASMTTDREQLLLPLAQHPDLKQDSVRVLVNDDYEGSAMLMLIARGAPGESPAKLDAALENAIRDVDRDFDRAAIVTGVSLRQNSMNDFLRKFGIGGIAGGVFLLLAALGIYGVVGLMVATRTREIAVRVTLGASRARVLGMILFDVLKLVAPGVAGGLIITVAIDRLLGGVALSHIESLAYVVGAVIATLVAILASLAPARRAASVEPMVAMRST